MEIRKSLLSRTISFLRFPMIFFILYLHVVLGAWSNGRIVSDTTFVGYELVRFIFVEGFSRIFVPCFFLISGFLFFYYSGFDRHIYWEKMKKRFRSLLVPYLFWNCFVIFLYFLGRYFYRSSKCLTSPSLLVIITNKKIVRSFPLPAEKKYFSDGEKVFFKSFGTQV